MKLLLFILTFPLITFATSSLRMISLTHATTKQKVVIVATRIDSITTNSVTGGSTIVSGHEHTEVAEPVRDVLKLMPEVCMIRLKQTKNSYELYIPAMKLNKVEKQSTSSSSLIFVDNSSFEVFESQDEVLKKIQESCK